AVIPACQPIAQIPAHAQARAAVRAAVLECMHRFAVSPQHNVFAKAREAKRAVFELPACADGIPVVAKPGAEQRVDPVLHRPRRSISRSKLASLQCEPSGARLPRALSFSTTSASVCAPAANACSSASPSAFSYSVGGARRVCQTVFTASSGFSTRPRAACSTRPRIKKLLCLLEGHRVEDDFPLADVLGGSVVRTGLVHAAFLPFDLFHLAVCVPALYGGVPLQ